VEAFLHQRISWQEIAGIVEETLDGWSGNADEVADVLDADRRARERAAAIVNRRSTA
jgi:1-deoxy-D-xylulose 5-phosphate reductoisomerase